MRPFAVVTGASRGIGAAYARDLAGRGWDLLLVARERDRLNALSGELEARHGVSAYVADLDLGLNESAHRLFVAARDRRDRVDLLINNAGFGLYGPFSEIPLPRIQAMLRLHMNTVVESMRLFLPGMLDRRTGGVINVASVAGFFPVPYFAEYSATKAFLINFSESVAVETRPFGVRIQVCCPGHTKTEFHATAGRRTRNVLGSRTADYVARYSLSALDSGPVVVTVGWQERAVAGLSRFIPRSILAAAAGRWMQSPNGKSDEVRRRKTE